MFWQKRVEIFGADSFNDEWKVSDLMEFAEYEKVGMALEGSDDIWYEDVEGNEHTDRPPPEPD